MKIIREEGGDNIIINGCGMPLSTGIGLVDLMRVGPDTAPYWTKLSGSFLQTGAMVGARNSIRNFIARSMMNKCLWLNDPDCLMIRKRRTSLTSHQRKSQINAIILSGGALLYSDDFSELHNDELEKVHRINELSEQCFKGKAISCDLMEKSLPEIYYNTSGYLGVFNFKNISSTKEIELDKYFDIPKNIVEFEDVWSDEKIKIEKGNVLKIKSMHPYSSKLFKIIK